MLMDDAENVTRGAEDAAAPFAEEVFRNLLRKIYNGDLTPGSVLNEVTLANEYGLSRGPVREAIRRLQGYRLVTREPYQRARVVRLTTNSMRQLFEVRIALEGMACALAAQRLNEDDLRRISDELEQFRPRVETSPGSHRPYDDEKVFDFHERIVRASGNERIVEMLCGDLYHLLRMYRKRSGAAPERKDRAWHEHWQIVRALKARDGDLAESLMRAHIGRAMEQLLAVDTDSPMTAFNIDQPV
jgi:DNA-binding GntR family transcriptional regulator